MSLNYNIQFIYTEIYPSKTIEEHQVLIDNEIKNIESLKERLRIFSCDCPVRKTVGLQITDSVLCTSSFNNIHPERLCSTCLASLQPFTDQMRAVGVALIDHWHPLLFLGIAIYTKNLLKDSLLCKQMDFGSLSLDELNRELRDSIISLEEYELEKHFHYQDDEVPDQLESSINHLKEIIPALQFEFRVRKIQETKKD